MRIRKQDMPEASNMEPFTSSNGWFEIFKKCTNLDLINRYPVLKT
jgi:hypothetical protein